MFTNPPLPTTAPAVRTMGGGFGSAFGFPLFFGGISYVTGSLVNTDGFKRRTAYTSNLASKPRTAYNRDVKPRTVYRGQNNDI